MIKSKRKIALFLFIIILVVSTCTACQKVHYTVPESVDKADIPAFSGESYVEIAENAPEFTEEEITDESYESYSPLDYLGRCGAAMACIGADLMPVEKREDIGSVKPTGWHSIQYDFVDEKSLYNRCHLIGFQLTGENANEKNLITGTRFMNVEGMLPFENMVADYIQETGNHVMYRVTPIYEGNNLIASGVQMEGYSVEDHGDRINYNVYCYNNQPGVRIDYATGESELYSENDDTASGAAEKGHLEIMQKAEQGEQIYVLNTYRHKFHKPDCPSVEQMDERNRKKYTGNREALIQEGYAPCGSCKP